MESTHPLWNGEATANLNSPLAQIVITRMRDGRFRVVCFDDHEVVDEMATIHLEELFELKDRLRSIRAWEPPL